MGALNPPEADARVRPLSFAQEQLWFLDQLAPGETSYSILSAWRLRGPLRADLLHRALNAVVARHESLRATIREQDGTPYQAVEQKIDVPLPTTDLRALPEAEREQRLRAEIEAQRDAPFDLEAGPLVRYRLIRLADDEYVFCQGYHHIVMDGWSSTVVNKELSTAYRALHAGTEPSFDAIELGYTAFAEAQRNQLTGAALAEELAFWQERLAGLPTLELPTDRPRPPAGSHRGQSLLHKFPPEVRTAVRELAESHGASPFMVLAAAFALVLSRYSGQDDVPVGVPMLGRPDPELEAVVGMFVNMVVLRADLSGDPAFSELIGRVADASLDLYDHQELPFTQVVDTVRPERHAGRNPLFQVSLQLLDANTSGDALSLPELSAELLPLEWLTSRFDLAVNLSDDGSLLSADVEYSTDLFDHWRIEALLAHLDAVVRGAAADPSRRLSQLPLMADAEIARLLAAGQGDRQAYIVDRTLNLVPRGVPGDLLISGEPADQEDEVCLPDPFRPSGSVRRTGDRARWTSDWRIEVLDRTETAEDTTRTETVEGASAAMDPGSGHDAPATPTEVAVAGIFGELLSRPGISAGDSFFGIGGSSLQAMLAVSRIKKAFGIKLSVRTLYGDATVRTVSAAVDELKG